MKTLSVLFILIMIFTVQSNFEQNSVFAQNNCVCATCGNPCATPMVHKKGYSCYQETDNKESNSSSTDIRLTIIQSLINSIFSDKSTDNKEKERQLKEQEKELERIAIEKENEKQRILKEQIAQQLHDNLMALTIKLPGTEELEEIKLSDYFDTKSFDGDSNKVLLDYKEISISPPGESTNQEILNTLITQLDGVKLSVDSIKLKKTENEKVIEEKKQKVEELTNKTNQTEDDQLMKEALLELEKAKNELQTAEENDEKMKEEIEKKEKLITDLEKQKNFLENDEK